MFLQTTVLPQYRKSALNAILPSLGVRDINNTCTSTLLFLLLLAVECKL